MKIAVNARFLLKDRLEGLGRFSDETLKRLVKNHPEHQFYFYFDRKYDEQFIYGPNVHPRIVHPPARHPYLYYIWFNWALPRYFKKDKPDLFFSPDGFLSLRTNIPSVPVIHDLAFEHFPQYVSAVGARYYKKNFPKFAKKAARIATVSEYSKKDIQELYGIPDKKIDVVYNGVNAHFQPVSENLKTETRNKYTDGNPYFVYVGALQPRKNILNLLKGFDSFKKETSLSHRLLIIGRDAWQNEEMKEFYESMGSKDEVIFTGRVSDEDLSKLLGSAEALTYIPFFEGFGLPLIEAFQCGVPAITADNSCLPEVAGDAALYCDANEPNQIASAMRELANKEELRLKLASNALERSKLFTWDKTADLLWQTIEQVLKSK